MTKNNYQDFLRVKDLREQLNNLDRKYDDDIVILCTESNIGKAVYKHDVKITSFHRELYIPSLDCKWIGHTKYRTEDEELAQKHIEKGDNPDFLLCTEEEKERAINCLTIYSNVE